MKYSALLQKAVNDYYRPGSPKRPTYKTTYKYLSSASRKIMDLKEWAIYSKPYDEVPIKSVEIINENVDHGRIYATVSIEEVYHDVDPKYNKNVYTSAWIIENGKWYRHSFPKLYELCDHAYKSGNYSSAKERAEGILALNPFSIDAYKLLGFSLMRLAEHGNSDASSSLDEITRTMLSINSNDSNANFFAAVTSRGNIEVAKNFMKRLEGTTSYLDTVFNVVSSNDDASKVLVLLKGIEVTPGIAMLKLRAIAAMVRNGSEEYKWVDFKTLALKEGSFNNITKHLKDNDASFSAHWAGTLGMLFVEANEIETAKAWLDYGLTRDPNNQAVQILISILSSDSCNSDSKFVKPKTTIF
jgi:hypothetical protein